MSEGLILLTNIGELVNAILRPAHKHPKEYIVAYNGAVSDSVVSQFKAGVILDDGPTLPARVERLGANRLRLILTEGRNRQIRRMAEAVELRVVRLKRVRVLNIELGELPKGHWRELTSSELQELGVLTGLDFSVHK
jgi:23S rRNA pseudouridine2604 synthase